MQIDRFNAYTSTPQGVFQPMIKSGRLEVKLADSAPGSHHFNHVNTDSAETYVIMKGDYSLRVGPPGTSQAIRIQATEGDVFSVPKGVPHGDVVTQTGYRILLLETPPKTPKPGSTFSKTA